MKKGVSIFVLTCVIIGSFYAQTANTSSKNRTSFEQSGIPNSGDHHYNKYFIFAELASETEDSELKTCVDFPNPLQGFDLLTLNPNKFAGISVERINGVIQLTSIALFLKNRRVLV